jgi:hypothetical protein
MIWPAIANISSSDKERILGKISALVILGCVSAIDSKPSYVVGFFIKSTKLVMLFRFGVAILKESGSRPTLGFVLVIPPVWHEAHEELNKRFPRFTCSVVKTVTFPAL